MLTGEETAKKEMIEVAMETGTDTDAVAGPRFAEPITVLKEEGIIQRS